MLARPRRRRRSTTTELKRGAAARDARPRGRRRPAPRRSRPTTSPSERLAEELDTPDRRAALAAALDGLAADADGLPSVTETLATLRGDPELAWRVYALALLADELADETERLHVPTLDRRRETVDLDP